MARSRPRGQSSRQRKRSRHRITLELLEPRQLFHGMPLDVDEPAYLQVSPQWFQPGHQSSEVAANGTVAISASSFIGPQRTPTTESQWRQQWVVRLSEQAVSRIGVLTDADELLDGEHVNFDVIRGLGLPGMLLVESFSADASAAASWLSSNAFVALFTGNDVVVGSQTPGDPSFADMTNLNNTGQFGSILDADIDGPEAWDQATGSPSVVVGVIDSGTDVTHEDLFLNIWLNQSEIPAGTFSQLIDLDGDGLITFWDLNNLRVVDDQIYVASTVVIDSLGTLVAGDLATVPQVSSATPFLAGENSEFVLDHNTNGRIDAIDLLGDSHWVDSADSDGNGFIDDLIGWNFRSAADEPFTSNDPRDSFGHGTHVSGTIGAVGNNGIGVSGINWRSSIMPIKFLDAQNQGSVADAIAAINYATLMRSQFAVNVRVTNNSWTVAEEANPLLRAAIESSGQEGILFVASAGNGDAMGLGIDLDATPAFPASFDLTNVVSVAASNSRDQLASFSNRGSTSVDLAAPGVGILSTLPADRYGSANGTSMAAAHASAVAALVWSVFPNATVAEVREAILTSVDQVSSFDGRVASNGRLNAVRSILAPVFTPQATVFAADDVNAEGTDPHSFIVQYTYTTGIDLSTLGDDDVRVTRSWGEGLQIAATLVPGSITTLPDGTVRATYEVDPPGGQWDVFDFGTYEIEVLPNSVASSNGLQFATGQQIGSFEVRIASPEVFYVNTVTDSVDANVGDGVCQDVTGACSLRAAIQEANAALPAMRVIILDVPESLVEIPHETDPLFGFLETSSVDGLPEVANITGWSNESSGDLDVLGNLRIIGNQTELTKIRGDGTDRLFKVHPGASLTLERVTLTGGIAPADQGGGAILSAGDVNLQRVLIDGNRTINESTGLGGGGIAMWAGNLQVRNSTFANNSAEIGGGLLATGGATADISESLFVQNHASSGKGEINPDPDRIGGGGIVGLKSGAINVQNSTFSANTTINAAGAAIGVYSLVPRVIVASTEVPRSIPDQGTRTSRLSVSGFNDVISDIRITLSIDHTFNSDLSVFLISPAGTRVELFTDVGEGSNNFTNTTFSDDALVDVGSGSAPFSGIFRPEGQLADFFGENPNGTWTLEVSDTTRDDVGTIRSWSLNLEPSEGSAAKGNLNHVTAAFNDGSTTFDGRVRPGSSLLAGNLGADFGPDVNDRGFNVVTDSQLIGPLQSLGGPTLAHPLIAGSPAFDAADANNFPSIDQRGSTRPQQGDDFRNGPDAGAIEMSGGSVQGVVFLDRDGNTIQGIDEVGLPQFVVFVDLNDNELLDDDEPRTLTHTGNQAGQYSFSNLPAGPHSVYLQVPSGWELSFQDTSISVRRSIEDGDQFAPGLSYDGNSVAFYSERPDDFDPPQTNLLVLNRGTGSYFSPSFEDEFGLPGDEIPYVAYGAPTLSADGHYVTFLNTFTLPFVAQPFDAIDVVDTRASDPVPAGSSVASELTGFQPIDGMVSLNGRYVIFTSDESVYLFDRQTATITDVVQGVGGAVANGPSSSATINQDGRYITFESAASNLVDNDTNGRVDVFVLDLAAQSVKRVSIANNGTESNADAGQSSISGDGRYIVFTTAASNLISNDSNNLTDVFVYDQQTTTLNLVSRSLSGVTGNGPSLDPSISANGRFVVFESAATNLVADDTNGVVDVFLYDRQSDTTIRIAPSGHNAVISGDGKFIAFEQGTETFVVNNPLASIANRTVFLNAGGTYIASGFGLIPADGELRGTLFEDLLPNAKRDAADLGLAGWTVYLDTIANGTLDVGEPQAITDSEGGYLFTNLPGYTTFQVRAQVPAGWRQVLPDPSLSSSREAFVGAGETVDGVDLGFARESTDGQNQNASLSGVIFDDKNKNGLKDAQEAFLPNVTVFLDLNHDGSLQEGEPAVSTDANGSYAISDLGFGDYTLRVNLNPTQGVSTPRGNDFTSTEIAARAGLGLLAGVQDMILADMNGDGLADLVTAMFEANQVVIRLNEGDGLFSSAPVRVPLSLGHTGPVALSAGQLNQLGSVDLVVVNQLSQSVTVLFDFNGASFASATNLQVGSQPSDAVIGDFDGVQGLDIVVSNAGSDTLTMMRNDGSGGFVATTIPSGGVYPASLVFADFNGDQLTDLAIANYGNHPTGSDLGNISILFNAGNATFSAPINYSAGFGPASIAAADLNADGRVDLAVASLLSNTVSVLLGADGGAFESTIRPINVATGPLQVLVEDIDQDGDRDLLVASATRQQVAILRNQMERGSFAISHPDWVSPAAESVDDRTEFAIVDLDDDGRSELLLAGYSGEFISVLGNKPGTRGAYRLSLTGDETISNLDFGIIPTLIEAIILEGSGETVDMKLLEESLRLSVKLIDIRGTGGNTLILDAPTIQTQTPNQTLLAIGNADDQVVFDAGWTFDGVETVDGQFHRIFVNGAATLRLVGPLSWTNPINRFDVNANGNVTASDALAVINALAPRLFVDNQDNLVDPTTVDPARFRFYDPNRDGRMTALDALVVINRIGQVGGGGEFEQVSLGSSDPLFRVLDLSVSVLEGGDSSLQSLDPRYIDAAIATIWE